MKITVKNRLFCFFFGNPKKKLNQEFFVRKIFIKERLLIALYLIIICIGITKTYFQETVEVFSMPVAKKVVLIDPGHGGWDPGMVSRDGDMEKDINLEVARKLQMYLEQGGAYVLTTRADDSALSDGKRGDLNARTKLANDDKTDIIISIHQNSFPSSKVVGAQVFYYGASENSRSLANSIQLSLKEFVDPENHRIEKADKSYYMLKRTKIPSVIVECGFLSNYAEKEKLKTEEYQEKIAWAIYMGITDYFNADSV